MLVRIKNRDVLIDDVHLDILQSRVWHISDTGYVMWRGNVDGKKKTIRLHRLIIGAKDNEIVDHINRDKMDNRLSNLRIVTYKENIHNSDRYESAKGYYFDSKKKRWTVDFRRIGVRSLYMDNEQACKDYISDKLAGRDANRVFTRRQSLGNRKITDEQVVYIFNEYRDGKKMQQIADVIGVSRYAVGRVLNGRTTFGGSISKRKAIK